jgi:hypothetical protein
MPCLVVLYSGIDVAASLEPSTGSSVGERFEKWVDRYMLKGTSLPCTARELYRDAPWCTLSRRVRRSLRDRFRMPSACILPATSLMSSIKPPIASLPSPWIRRERSLRFPARHSLFRTVPDQRQPASILWVNGSISSISRPTMFRFLRLIVRPVRSPARARLPRVQTQFLSSSLSERSFLTSRCYDHADFYLREESAIG